MNTVEVLDLAICLIDKQKQKEEPYCGDVVIGKHKCGMIAGFDIAMDILRKIKETET